MLNKVKKAKELKEQGIKVKDMEDQIGIARAYIPKLLELYDAMSDKENMPVVNNPDYVVIRKQKYITLSLRIQNKFDALRKEFVDTKRVLQREKGKLLKAKYSFIDVKDMKEEMDTKQLMLNVTSKNLQHAEDGYEYLKQEVHWNYFFYFLGGIAFTLFLMIVARETGFIK